MSGASPGVRVSEERGQVRGPDRFVRPVCHLAEKPRPHLVYKHAIIHLAPSRDFKLPPELGPKPAPESKPKEAQQSDPKRAAVQIHKKRLASGNGPTTR